MEPGTEFWHVDNSFRARPTIDNRGWPDLGIMLDDHCIASCEDGPVKIAYSVFNQGCADVPAGGTVRLTCNADTEPVECGVHTLGEVLSGKKTQGATFEVQGPEALGDFLLRVELPASYAAHADTDPTNDALDIAADWCP